MRALCGAIMVLGSSIGLGLTAVSIGIRYSGVVPTIGADGKASYLKLHDLDTALLVVLVITGTTLVIGIGVSFLGLAYHHERRHHEFLARTTTNSTAGLPIS